MKGEQDWCCLSRGPMPQTRQRRNGCQSVAPLASMAAVEPSQVAGASEQFDHDRDMMVLLKDIVSKLKASEHYI